MERNRGEVPNRQRLLEIFNYEKSTGKLFWKERPHGDFSKRGLAIFNGRFAGKEAGSPLQSGHMVVTVNRVSYRVHRIIWTMCNGPIPDDMQIDHIDGDPRNNIIDNLRLVTNRENGLNQKRSSNNTSGYNGVSFCNGRWRSYCTVNGKQVNFGRFNTAIEAFEAGVEYRRKIGYTERHIGTSGV